MYCVVRQYLCVIAVIGGCLFQGGCGEVPPSPQIASGIYTGTVSDNKTWMNLLTGESEISSPASQSKSITFDESGWPITNGQQISQGTVIPRELGSISIFYTVTDITASSNGYSIKYNAEGDGDFGFGTSQHFTGNGTLNLQKIDENSIRWIDSLEVTFSPSNYYLLEQMEGVLTK